MKNVSDQQNEKFEQEKNFLRYIENLIHVLPYDLIKMGIKDRYEINGVKIVGETNVINENNQEESYYVKRIQTTNAGLAGFVLFSEDSDNIHVLFKGTSDKEGWGRNLTEDIGYGPGSKSFADNKLQILKAIEETIKYKINKNQNIKIKLNIAGHSLGGADAQMCTAAVLEKLASKKHTENFSNITELNLMHANSAGINRQTEEIAKKSLETIRRRELDDNDNQNKLKVNQHIIHLTGDIVQQAGATTILHDEKYDSVHTKMYNFVFNDGENEYGVVQAFRRHLFMIFENAIVDTSKFKFFLLDNADNDEHKLHTLSTNMNYKQNEAFHYANIITKLSTNVVKYLRFASNLKKIPAHQAKFKKIALESLPILSDLVGKFEVSKGIPLISESQLDSLMSALNSFSSSVSDKIEQFDRLYQKNINIPLFLDMNYCLYTAYYSYNHEYEHKFDNTQKNLARFGFVLMGLSTLCMAGYFSGFPQMQAMNYLAKPLFKEGLYLFKIAMNDKKNVNADESFIIKNLNKLYNQLPEHERTAFNVAKKTANTLKDIAYEGSGLKNFSEKMQESTRKLGASLIKITSLKKSTDILDVLKDSTICLFEMSSHIAILGRTHNNFLKLSNDLSILSESLQKINKMIDSETNLAYLVENFNYIKNSFNESILPYIQDNKIFSDHHRALAKSYIKNIDLYLNPSIESLAEIKKIEHKYLIAFSGAAATFVAFAYKVISSGYHKAFAIKTEKTLYKFGSLMLKKTEVLTSDDNNKVHDSEEVKAENIFDGYIPQNKKVSGGKQIKAAGTGLYQKTDDNTSCYIKRSGAFPNDDLAEYISSEILAALVDDDKTATCNLVVHNQTQEVFLASNFARGTEHEVLQKQGKLSGCWRKASRDQVYDKLDRQGLKKDFAQILAACMLVGEYDVHPGNFILYKDANKYKIYKIDHGWGLNNICAQDNSNLMQMRYTFGTYGDFYRYKPANHFSNYDKIIYSKDFIEAIDNVLEQYNKKDMLTIIIKSLNKFEELYPENYDKQTELLAMVATHIGDNNFANQLKSTPETNKNFCLFAKSQISYKIANKLEERKVALQKLKNKLHKENLHNAVNNPTLEQAKLAAENFNRSKNGNELDKITNYFKRSGTPNPESKDFAQFFLENNHLLDQDKGSFFLTDHNNKQILIEFFNKLNRENQEPDIAFAMMLRSRALAIPRDPDGLNCMIECFAESYLSKNTNSFLAELRKESQQDFFKQLLCLTASNMTNNSKTYNDFYCDLDNELRNKYDKNFFLPHYNRIKAANIDLEFTRQKGILFEKVNLKNEKTFNKLYSNISTSEDLSKFQEEYTYFPKGCKVEFVKPQYWLEYLIGSSWSLKIYSDSKNQEPICTVNYSKPNIFLSVFGVSEKLQFLPNYKYPKSLELTVKFANEMKMSPKKILSDGHFSAKDIKDELMQENISGVLKNRYKI